MNQRGQLTGAGLAVLTVAGIVLLLLGFGICYLLGKNRDEQAVRELERLAQEGRDSIAALERRDSLRLATISELEAAVDSLEADTARLSVNFRNADRRADEQAARARGLAGDLRRFIVEHEPAISDSLAGLIESTIAACDSTIAAKDETIAACELQKANLQARLDLVTQQLDSAQAGWNDCRTSFATYVDSVEAANTRVQKGWSAPRYALEIGKYAGLAIGAACVLKEWVFDGGSGRGTDVTSLGLHRDLRLRLGLTFDW